jgi:RNA polymerase sigma-70 factor, ECF subfamily
VRPQAAGRRRIPGILPPPAPSVRVSVGDLSVEETVTAPPHTHQGARDEAFEQEALPWLDDVYRFALSLTRDEADAEDVVQDTFLRAYRSWETYAVGTDCRRWLFTICRNAFLRSREREQRTIELHDGEYDAFAAGALSFPEAPHSGIEDVLFRVDLLPAMQRALARVPAPFQSALVLVDVEEQSYEAAAEILGIPIGTLRSRLFRGRRIMQALLVTHARDAGILRS